jgi:hypothetical protein
VLRHGAFEDLVRMRAEQEQAAAENEGGDRVDAVTLRFARGCIHARRVAALRQGRLRIAPVQSHFRDEREQNILVADVRRLRPVGVHEAVVDRLMQTGVAG